MYNETIEEILDVHRNGPTDETEGERKQKLETLFRPLIKQVTGENNTPIDWPKWVGRFETRILKQGLKGVIDWAAENLSSDAQRLLVMNLKDREIDQHFYLPSDLPSHRLSEEQNPLGIIDYIEKRFTEVKK